LTALRLASRDALIRAYSRPFAGYCLDSAKIAGCPEISKNWVTIRRPGGFPGKINHVPLPP